MGGGAMRTALEMATFFWVGPISLLAAGRGKTGARADFGESSRDRTWRKRRIKTPGGPARLVCRGRNHGAQRDGCDAMRWDGESQTPKGLDGAPPKGELGTWGRVQQLAEGPGPGPGLQQSRSRKPPRKSNGAKTAVQCGCALAAVSIDKTARHPSPKAPKRTRRFTVHALGKKRLARAVSGGLWPAPDGRADCTAKPSQRRGSPIGPLFPPRLRHGNLPTVCHRLHAHGAGVCASRAGNGKSHSDPCSGTAVIAYLSMSNHDSFLSITSTTKPLQHSRYNEETT